MSPALRPRVPAAAIRFSFRLLQTFDYSPVNLFQPTYVLIRRAARPALCPPPDCQGPLVFGGGDRRVVARDRLERDGLHAGERGDPSRAALQGRAAALRDRRAAQGQPAPR